MQEIMAISIRENVWNDMVVNESANRSCWSDMLTGIVDMLHQNTFVENG